MNYRRILAFAAALCLVPACMNYGIASEITSATAAEETTVDADTIYITCVGDKSPIELSGTTEIPKWYSDDETIAKIETTGNLSVDIIAVGKGKTSVYAVFSNQILRFNVEVLKADANEKIIRNIGTATLTSQQNSATAQLTGVNASEAIWKTSDPSVAVVDNKGNITAVAKGECIITAEYGDYIYVLNIISEYEPAEEQPVPEKQFLGKISLTDDDPVKKITVKTDSDDTVIEYKSSDEKIAVVDEKGIITAKGSGKCIINITVDGKYENYYEIESTYTGEKPIVTNLGSITLTDSLQSQNMTLSNIGEGKTVKWRSLDESVAFADPEGLIVAVSSGECRVIAEVDGNEYTLDVKVDISDESSLAVSEVRGIGNIVKFGGLSGNVRFYSSNPAAAPVDEKGNVTAAEKGFAVITAHSDNEVSYIRVLIKERGLIGDANCDGVISIADATAILQHIGNSDKYGLSETGLINGDVDGNVGITGNDAVVIQMFDAGMINSLPYKKS